MQMEIAQQARNKSESASHQRECSKSPNGGRRSQTPADTALKSNSATVKHSMNRVSMKHKMDITN